MAGLLASTDISDGTMARMFSRLRKKVLQNYYFSSLQKIFALSNPIFVTYITKLLEKKFAMWRNLLWRNLKYLGIVGKKVGSRDHGPHNFFGQNLEKYKKIGKIL